ncbi:hypothetical protein [Vibrio vulnificus]|uniref:hypothetical protein n=1 Tax=Vibrio vulnificus TaxID=672 RepID=UPI00102A28BC|nr:hypothetical protein [Vibrio vulnificus]RZP88962.1 hypothetical protein D8T54_20255 [Vibrio vulnificus]
MTQITKAQVSVLHRASGSTITNAQLRVLARQSGSHTTSASVTALRKTMQPSVRVAANYFETEKVSLREVFQKTGKQSLRELVHLEDKEIPY